MYVYICVSPFPLPTNYSIYRSLKINLDQRPVTRNQCLQRWALAVQIHIFRQKTIACLMYKMGISTSDLHSLTANHTVFTLSRGGR